MWVSAKFKDWFHISRDHVATLEQERAALTAENVALKAELARLSITFDWLRIQYNNVQLERTALLNAHYNIQLPTPELAKQPVMGETPTIGPEFTFEDWGDEWAKRQGAALP